MTQHVNLGEGMLPPGSPDRRLVASMLLHVVRDYLAGGRRQEEAQDLLASTEGALLCRCLGIPVRTLTEHLQLIVDDPQLLIAFTRSLCRRTPEELYRDLMAEAA